MSRGEGGAGVLVLSDHRDVLSALERTDLLPHASADPSNGPTARLRAAMARFSGPDEHGARRTAVVEAVASVDPDVARRTATDRARVRLMAGVVDASDLARIVPTEALASCLGLTAESDSLVADVEAIVRVIGRGEPASAASDAAAERLVAACAACGDDAVALVSMLYQNFDATAALLMTTLGGDAAGTVPVAAVPRTRRRAPEETTVAGRPVAAGDEVVLEIGAAGLPFGAGPHRCPGEQLATSIVSGIASALAAAGVHADLTGLEVDADGRPTRLPLVVPT